MPTYKTPDVYTEEISVFPPSVAEVETAIPAFIGYTEKAMNITTDDLRDVPTRVKSLLEFETYFGGAPAVTLNEVEVGASNEFLSASLDNDFYLYDSLRAFFDNGGGPCYIVSVGDYGDTVASSDFTRGLAAIKKYDEPTMLLFPDAAALGAGDLGTVQQAALSQCASLKDRVAVLDTTKADTDGSLVGIGDDFRNNIGINNLKYGAAYAPWLKVKYDKNLSYADINAALTKGGISVSLSDLTTDSEILGVIENLDDALLDLTTVENISTYLSGSDSASARYAVLYSAYQSSPSAATIQALFTFLFNLASYVDALLTGGDQADNGAFRTLIENSITNTLLPTYRSMIANEKEIGARLNVLTPASYTEQWSINPDPSATQWNDPTNNLFTTGAPGASTTPGVAGAADAAAVGAIIVPMLNQYFSTINAQIDAILAAPAAYVDTYENTLYDIFSIYKNIVLGINSSLTVIPPSGAVAGVYAMVDNQRGVWKAPANVSLSNVVAPVYNFDTDETDSMNVDVTAGKSINAIRAFSGKGTLVWGARTLAGNDNEWRYVSVRRFFNMVEESIKKSTYWAVFEPNDANTWVKVRGMIENYLTQKWREGALAGATTKEAFFVRCGLGVTMTAQDILEGRMNVEIGMAVVRPAEFIILKFSHMLQTS